MSEDKKSPDLHVALSALETAGVLQGLNVPLVQRRIELLTADGRAKIDLLLIMPLSDLKVSPPVLSAVKEVITHEWHRTPRTIQDIASLRPADVCKYIWFLLYSNIGRQNFLELRQALFNMGLFLKGDEQWSPGTDDIQMLCRKFYPPISYSDEK